MMKSNIQWIGEYPNSWKLDRLSWHMTEINEKNNPIKTTKILSLTNKLGVVPYEEKGNQGNVAKENYDEYKLAYPNTIVANSMNILIGSVGKCDYFGCVSPAYYVFKPNKNENIDFLNYIFQTEQFQKELRCYANGILEIRLRLSSNDIIKREIPYPPLRIQNKIVAVLNDKTSKIDALIENENKQIEKLKEYKQAIITKAVTKGLNPNVPMKDSGIEWIGKIPCNWEIVHLSSLFYQLKNKNKGMACNNLLSLSYGNVVRRDINKNDGLLPENFEGYNIINEGDIVLRLTDLQNDHKSLRTGYCTEKGIITSAYITLRKKQNINTHFVRYYLHAFDIQKGFYGLGDGVRQGLTFDGIKTLPILLPPLEEQNAIENFLNVKCSEIKKLILLKEQTIERLKDYRKSLIFEYVTGKKEVL